MAPPRDTDQQLLRELSDSAEIIRQRTRRVYRDMELLRRLTAQHTALLERHITDTSQEDDTDGSE